MLVLTVIGCQADERRIGGSIDGQIGATDLAAIVVSLDHGGATDVLGREQVSVAVTADDQRDWLAGLNQLAGQRLIAIDGEAIAIAAIGITEMRQHDDRVGAGGLDRIVVMNDRIRRVLEAQTLGRRGNRDVRRLLSASRRRCPTRLDCLVHPPSW